MCPVPGTLTLRACAPVPAIVVTVRACRSSRRSKVIFGVGDVQDVAIQGHTLGMVERGRVKIPVGLPKSTTAGDV